MPKLAVSVIIFPVGADDLLSIQSSCNPELGELVNSIRKFAVVSVPIALRIIDGSSSYISSSC